MRHKNNLLIMTVFKEYSLSSFMKMDISMRFHNTKQFPRIFFHLFIKKSLSPIVHNSIYSKDTQKTDYATDLQFMMKHREERRGVCQSKSNFLFMSSAVECPCSPSEDKNLISKLSNDAIYISMSYITRISTCTSTKTPENNYFQERILIKAKDYAEEFQGLF